MTNHSHNHPPPKFGWEHATLNSNLYGNARRLSCVETTTTALTMDPQPILLPGRWVRLEPLLPAHAPELFGALRIDPDVWRWLPVEPPDSGAGMEAFIAGRLQEQAMG